MKLNPQQLTSHLSSGIQGVYLLSGDEPLLVEETLDEIRETAHKNGFDEREAHLVERSFDWDEFEAGLQNLSLFAPRRLIELRLPTGKPGEKGAKKIVTLVVDKIPDTILIFIMPRLDKQAANSKWARTLAREGVWINHHAPDRGSLPRWIEGRLEKAGLSCDADALDLLAARVEGNLLAARQEIDKLALLADGTHIDIDTMRDAVTDGARYDVFQLTDAALAGNGRRAARILQGLKREGVAAPLVMWSLGREISVLTDVVHGIDRGLSAGRAMSDARVWQARQNLIGHAARQLDVVSARELLRRASETDRIIKGARFGQTWNALMELTLTLSGSGGRDSRVRS